MYLRQKGLSLHADWGAAIVPIPRKTFAAAAAAMAPLASACSMRVALR